MMIVRIFLCLFVWSSVWAKESYVSRMVGNVYGNTKNVGTKIVSAVQQYTNITNTTITNKNDI